MSAVSAYFPESGRLECIAAFPEEPPLAERGLRDGVGGLYVDMAKRGELLQLGKYTSDLSLLMAVAVDRFGYPAAVSADRWRKPELMEALEENGVDVDVLWRGQGYKDGAADVRVFRKAVMDGEVRPVESLLLTSALSEAVVVRDEAGNSKLSKGGEGGRRQKARDDAAASSILAVALGHLYRDVEGPAYRYGFA